MGGATAFLAVLLGATTAMALEEPEYDVLRRGADYEVRRYPPYVVAELTVTGSFEGAGSQAFRPLAAFISGANVGSTEISMTAPVTQRRGEKIGMTAPVTQRPTSEGDYVVQFVMPSRYTLETVPRPTDERIRLREEPEQVVAVHSYSGTWSEGRYREHEARLREALARDGLRPAGDPVWARFDSPFKLWFLRRNEIWLPLDWSGEGRPE